MSLGVGTALAFMLFMLHEVRNWMTKEPIVVDASVKALRAAEKMRDHVINHVLVFENSHLAGILSRNDLEFVGDRSTVSDVMAKSVATVSVESRMSDALKVMIEKEIHCVPVVDEGEVVGILTWADLLRYAVIASKNIKHEADYGTVKKILKQRGR